VRIPTIPNANFDASRTGIPSDAEHHFRLMPNAARCA
jgi:hypothetical protein